MAEAKEKKQPVVARRTSDAFKVDVRPFNCPAELTADGKRCPNCNQVHLRPGYCHALDPINATKYPHLHGAASSKMPISHRAETVTDKSVTREISELANSVTDSTPRVTDSEAAVTDNAARVCEMCGTLFAPKRIDARFCSASCRVKSNREGR
jgi:hypothetical protein